LNEGMHQNIIQRHALTLILDQYSGFQISGIFWENSPPGPKISEQCM
jgi:hypothetical protein